MEEEFEDESIGSGEDSLSGEEMDDDQIQIEPRELQQALLEEEKNGTSLTDIQELWNSSQPLIKESQEGVSLYTTYVYLLRRMGASVDELKQVFLQGQKTLSELFGDYWDANGSYQRNYAYFLYTKAKQPDEALKIWKGILATEWEDQYNWIEAARLERHFGSVENARALLYKAIGSKPAEAYDLFQYFVQFEREEGTREQVDTALQKINAASRAVRNNKPQQHQKKWNERSEKPANKKPSKRKADSQKEPEQPRKIAKVPDEPQPSKSDNSSNAAPKSEPVSYSTGEEKTKLFVRNVDFKTTTEQLRTLFAQYGSIKEVRIVHHKNGKPKGFAYVEYGDEQSAQKGLAADKQKFNGRTLQVYISDPSLNRRKDENGEQSQAARFGGGQTANSNASAEESRPTVLGGGQPKRATGFSLKPRILLDK